MPTYFIPLVVAMLAALSVPSPVLGQAPTTAVEARAVVQEMVDVSNEIVAAERERPAIDARWEDLQGRIRAFNAAQPCRYPPGRPEVCHPNAERGRILNQEHDGLVAERARLPNLRSRRNMLLTRLRLAPLLGGLQEWRDRVVACANLPNAVAAAACLQREWERYP